MHDLAARILSAPLGSAWLFSTGQAGYIVKTPEGRLIAVDLYLSNCVERIEGHKGYKRMLPQVLYPTELEFDAVVCTHPHLDHFDIDAVPEMIANGRTKLYCSVDCEKLIHQLQLEYYAGQTTYIAPGDRAEVGDAVIDFVDCDHGTGAPDAVGVILTTGGKKLYWTGDTCLRLDRADSLPKDIDILFGPINGAYGNMNEEDLPLLAEALSPGLTIPCHYGMFASHHGDPGKFYDIMKEKKLPCLILCQGEQIRL